MSDTSSVAAVVRAEFATSDQDIAAGDVVLVPPTGPMRAICERSELTLVRWTALVSPPTRPR